MMSARLLVIWMLAVPTASVAQQIDVNAGQILCTAWTRSNGDPAQQDHHATMAQWTVGFLSGLAVLNDRIKEGLGRTKGDEIAHWIDVYCELHPNDTIGQAAAQFSLKLLDNSN
jgi:hypothetical protein